MDKKVSFSKYNKASVFAEYEKCCKKGDFESACFWMMEIYLSDWFQSWKLKSIIFASKFIHVENPNILQPLVEFEKNRKEIDYAFGITGILAMSSKGTIYQFPKISEDHLSTTFLMSKFTSLHPIVQQVSKKNENEIIQYTMSLMIEGIQEGDINKAILWLGWTIILEKLHKKPIQTISRPWKHIPAKHTTDWIWFFWDCILAYNNSDTTRYHNLQYLLVLFLTDYKPASKSQLSSCLIHALLLSTVKSIDFKIDPYIDRKRISAAISKVDYMHNSIVSRNKGISYSYEIGPQNGNRNGNRNGNPVNNQSSSADIVDKLLFNI